LIAPLQSLPEDEKQTHFDMPASTDDVEIDAVLSLLAGESSDSTHTELMAITAGQELGEEVETRRPEGAHPKRPCRVSRPTAPIEEKGRRGDFDDCLTWTRVQALLLWFLMMYRQRPILRLMARVVIVHRLLSTCLMRTKRKKKRKSR
jgi:hypothetical protein